MKSRKRGPRAIGEMVDRLTRPVFGRRGFSESAILTEWPTIAGATLARHTSPEKIVFPDKKRRDGTLELRVDHGSLATELIHLEPVLIERINRHFGFRAIARLKIVQGPLPERTPERKQVERKLGKDGEATLKESLTPIDDPELRDALDRLGRAVLGGNRTDGKS